MTQTLFGSLAPALQGFGASLLSQGDLSQAGAFTSRFQTAQAQQQLRNLQIKQLQQKGERDEALRAALGQGGLFGSLTRDERAVLAADPALARDVLTAQFKQKLAPPQMTPFDQARIDIARSKEEREQAQADREAEEAETQRRLRQALLNQLGFSTGQPQQGQVPSVAPTRGFQQAPPGLTLDEAQGRTPAEAAAETIPSLTDAMATVPPQQGSATAAAPTSTAPPSPAIDPETKRLAMFQIASGDTTAGLKTLNDARKEINKRARPTTKQRNDFARVRTAVRSITTELEKFRSEVRRFRSASLNPLQRQRLSARRRNIQLQLKELFNLGVLNGPDLDLMNQMLFDPVVPMGSGFEAIPDVLLFPFRMIDKAIFTERRANDSIDQLRDMMTTLFNAQAANIPGAQPLPAPSQAAPQQPAGTVSAAPARRVFDIEGNPIR